MKKSAETAKINKLRIYDREDFRFGDKLGEGGLGNVYHAIDKKTDREVAVKAMKKAQIIDEGQVAHILDEK